MCDTSVAVGSATVDGSVIFAKNSDRKANECQPLDFYPGQAHAPNSVVRCTYREIPQVSQTYAVLGSRPYWIWGFEMGVNEHGVAIGNEAVYGREGHEENGLLGMDYLRLGLERGRTAYEALHVIVDLLEQYGQGGVADIIEPRSYHNSFIIADPSEAWVLETAGRYWVAERVKGRRAISNCYTIGTDWDEASADLIDHAVAQGWWTKGSGDFSFALAYGDSDHDVRSGQCRFTRATDVLRQQNRLGVLDLLQVLRDHAGVIVESSEKSIAAPICMHEVPPRVGATAASFVAHLRKDHPADLNAVVWHSFGSPCLSGFQPLLVAAGSVPDPFSIGGKEFDAASPWWLNERIQRRADMHPGLGPTVQEFWKNVEGDAFRAWENVEMRVRGLAPEAAREVLIQTSHDLAQATLGALRRLDELTERLSAAMIPPEGDDLTHWTALNRAVGLELGSVASLA